MNTTQQKATLPAGNVMNGRWVDNKEQFKFKAVVAFKDGELTQPVTVRWWASRRGDGAGAIWCTTWAHGTHDNGRDYSGHGRATGCGYHKTSAALQAAIDSAGIKLAQPIDGRGDSAEDEALTAIARALGYETTTIVSG